MTGHVKCGIHPQEKNYIYWRDTRMLCMLLHSTILMGRLSVMLG